jgi:hypothetical protein
MTEDELNAKIESELNARIEARLQAERARERAAIAAQLRREAEMAEYDRINARHPIQGPGDPQVEAERRAAMDARAKADSEVTVAVSFRRSRAPCLARPAGRSVAELATAGDEYCAVRVARRCERGVCRPRSFAESLAVAV